MFRLMQSLQICSWWQAAAASGFPIWLSGEIDEVDITASMDLRRGPGSLKNRGIIKAVSIESCLYLLCLSSSVLSNVDVRLCLMFVFVIGVVILGLSDTNISTLALELLTSKTTKMRRQEQ